jgi:hypothetical protein
MHQFLLWDQGSNKDFSNSLHNINFYKFITMSFFLKILAFITTESKVFWGMCFQFSKWVESSKPTLCMLASLILIMESKHIFQSHEIQVEKKKTNFIQHWVLKSKSIATIHKQITQKIEFFVVKSFPFFVDKIGTMGPS